jgi:hypothetical protein
MPANRKDTVTVDGEVLEVIYAHNSQSVTLKGDTSEFVLNEVEGQYVLERPQRRDLVVNELLSAEDRGNVITSADLIKQGFRLV